MTTENQIKGSTAEQQFLLVVKKSRPVAIIVTASTYQNIHEDWDFSVNGVTFDVKAVKRTDQPNTNFTILEILNNQGNRGWLFGDAQYIAFQSGNSFVLVNRQELCDYRLENVQNDWVDSLKDAVLKIYRRKHLGFKDAITVVPFADLLRLKSTRIIYDK